MRQQLYDLQDQLITAGETTAGFKDHMIENNQTLAGATAALEGYNSTIANYEGASAAIISGDQAKISESLALLTNDFQTSETSTRESLETVSYTHLDVYKRQVKGTLSIPYYAADGNTIRMAYAEEFKSLTSTSGKFTNIELTGYLAGALSKVSKLSLIHI